jgi:D-alanine--poly(phosphoribitol) ligase subunit 2
MATATSDQVIDLLARVADAGEVRTNPDLALYDLQILDSMKTVELIVALQQEMGVEVSPAEFDRDAWATPAKMVADIQKRLGT